MKRVLALCAAVVAAFTIASCTKEAPSLTLNLEEMAIPSTGALSIVNVYSNTLWTASSTEDWIVVSDASGEGDGEFSVTVGDNIGPEGVLAPERVGYVDVTAGEIVCRIKVTQAGEVSVIEMEGLGVPVEISQAGGKFVIVLKSNAPYTISCDYSWIKNNGTKGLKTDRIEFEVEENASYSPRAAAIIFSNGEDSQTASVFQDGRNVKNLLAIKDSADFRAFSEHQDLFAGKSMELTADIEITYDMAVDTLMCNFTGQDHTITLSHVETATHKSANFGIFKCIGEGLTVRNVNAVVTFGAEEGIAYQDAHVGAIAGHALKNSWIDECKVSLVCKVKNTSAAIQCGGVVGTTESGTVVSKCSSDVELASLAGTTTADQIGGIIGHSNGDIDVLNCDAKVNMSYLGRSNPRMGGVIGYTMENSHLLIKSCTTSGVITHDPEQLKDAYDYLGGIVAYTNTFAIENPSYVIEDCTCSCTLNGFCNTETPNGTNPMTYKIRMGGICPQMPKKSGSYPSVITIKGCKFTGAIITDLAKIPSSTKTIQNAGILAFGEADCVATVQDCEVSATFESKQVKSTIGGIVGALSNVACEVINCKVRGASKIAVTDDAVLGLMVASPGAWTKPVTGSVGPVTATLGTLTGQVSETNMGNFLFGNTNITDHSGIKFDAAL